MIVTSELWADLTRAELIELAIVQDNLIRTQNELITLSESVIGKINDRA